jgi:chromosomal replication initiation ATPase DnaA
MEILNLKYESRVDVEIANHVIKAVCDYFDINSEQFFSSHYNRKISYARKLTFFFIKGNTELSFSNLSRAFKIDRKSIHTGISEIHLQRQVFTHISHDLQNIIKLVNNFEKKYEWQLQLGQ